MNRAPGKYFPPKVFFWLALCLFSFVPSDQAADANSLATPARAFYIIGHQADTLAVAADYIVSGANGIECNVDTLAGHPGSLYIGHGPWLGTGPVETNAMPLMDFLNGLHALARANSNFCLVYFDCKSLAATPDLGRMLLDDIRTVLVGTGDDRAEINAIISVGTLKDRAMFAKIADDLGPHEAVMVDGVSRPGRIADFLDSTRARHRCFSDGTVPFNTCLSHFEIFWAVKKACKLRDRDHRFCFVGTWTVNNPWLMKRFIKMGVDGIVVDRKFHWYNFSWVNLGRGLPSLERIVQCDGPKLGVRLANRADNPFSNRP